MPNTPPEQEEHKATPEATKSPIQAEEREKELKVPSQLNCPENPKEHRVAPKLHVTPNNNASK